MSTGPRIEAHRITADGTLTDAARMWSTRCQSTRKGTPPMGTQAPPAAAGGLNKITTFDGGRSMLLGLSREQGLALAWHLFVSPPVGEAEATLDSVTAALREEFGDEIRTAMARTARSLERLDGGTL